MGSSCTGSETVLEGPKYQGPSSPANFAWVSSHTAGGLHTSLRKDHRCTAVEEGSLGCHLNLGSSCRHHLAYGGVGMEPDLQTCQSEEPGSASKVVFEASSQEQRYSLVHDRCDSSFDCLVKMIASIVVAIAATVLLLHFQYTASLLGLVAFQY